MTMSMLGHTYQWQKYQIQSICVRDKRKTEHLRPDRRELKSEDSMASFPCDEATLTRQLREASSYRRDSIMSTHTLWLTWPLPSVSQLHMKTWNIANETTGESKQLRGLRATEWQQGWTFSGYLNAFSPLSDSLKQDMDGVFVVESTDLAVTLALRHIEREHSIRRERGSNFTETVHFSSPLCELRLCLTAHLLWNTDAAMLVVLTQHPGQGL